MIQAYNGMHPAPRPQTNRNNSLAQRRKGRKGRQRILAADARRYTRIELQRLVSRKDAKDAKNCKSWNCKTKPMPPNPL
jgi:hypothetical protein